MNDFDLKLIIITGLLMLVTCDLDGDLHAKYDKLMSDWHHFRAHFRRERLQNDLPLRNYCLQIFLNICTFIRNKATFKKAART